jgi:hypothetical protein
MSVFSGTTLSAATDHACVLIVEALALLSGCFKSETGNFL